MNHGTILLAGGMLGGAISGTTAMAPGGLTQTFPYCNSVASAGAPVEEFQGTIVDVHVEHPCVGQPGYQIARVRLDDRVIAVYLSPGAYLAAQGVDLTPGEALSGYAARSGAVFAALTVEVQGKSVTLRDEGGRPLWRPSKGRK